MTARASARHLGLLLALLLSAAAVAYQDSRPRPGYTRVDLPTFDSYVYMTMADEPAFFTAAPWGYRLLLPRLVHLMPPRARLAGFRDLARAALVACGGLLFLFLRRLGHPEPWALLGVALFLLSRPVGLALGSPLLGDTLSVLLELLALLAVAARAGTLALAAVLALGMLSKELFLLMPALLFRDARIRGVLLAGAPALAVLLLLRFHWTPYLDVPHPPWSLALVRAGAAVLAEQWRDTSRALLLSGIMPLALAGAALRESRDYLRRHGWLALVCVALSLTAWLNVPSRTPIALYGANTERLLIYALPLLVPLALVPLQRLLRVPAAVAAVAAPGRSRLVDAAAVACLAAALVLPLAGVDRYRRLPLHEPRDGPLLMAFCRESLRAARRLDRGEEVSFDPQELRFAWGSSDPGGLFAMRWFLRQGWGPLAHYGIDDVRLREARATLVLPCLRPRAVAVTLELEAKAPLALELLVNGTPAGRAVVEAGRSSADFLAPAALLFRGDNLLTLSAGHGAPTGMRLLGYRLRAAS